MAKLQHTFIKGKMNKDLDERLIPNGEYRDASNVQVSTSEGADVGAVENIIGNSLKNSEGSGDWNDSFGLTGVKCIGTATDPQNEKIYWFLTSNTADAIVEFDQATGIVAPVLVDMGSVLNFSSDFLITGVNVLSGLLMWTDNRNEPRVIKISLFKAGSNNQGGNNFAVTTQVYGRNFIDTDITVIKLKPNTDPVISMDSSLRSGFGSGLSPAFLTKNFTEQVPAGSGNHKPLQVGTQNVTLTGVNDGTGQSPQPIVNWAVGDIIVLTAQRVNTQNFDDTYEIRIKITATALNNPVGTIESISLDLPFGPYVWTCVLEEDNPMFEFNFPRFAYRWKYVDNEYSAFSPWTDVAFLPGLYDYDSANVFNKAMINNLRKLTLNTFETAPKGVIEIDILYKDSASPTVYKVDSIAATATTFAITSELIYNVISSEQTIRPYDNVPKKAKSQEIVGNRIVYGNYTQNYDVPDNSQISIAANSVNNPSLNSPLSSLKSQRTYQVGIVYLDEYGRETPVFTNDTATIILPKSLSTKKNRLSVTSAHTKPAWNPTHFKYYVKDISSEYYNFVLDRFYDAEDGNMWLSIPSAERNKVAIDDFIILKKEHNTSLPVEDAARYKIIDISNEVPRPVANQKTQLTFGQISNGVATVGAFKVTFTGPTITDNPNFSNAFVGGNFIRLQISSPADQPFSNYYEIKTGGLSANTTSSYTVNLKTPLGQDIGASIGNAFTVYVYENEQVAKPEYQGKFFAKVNRDTALDNAIIYNFTNDPSYYTVKSEISIVPTTLDNPSIADPSNLPSPSPEGWAWNEYAGNTNAIVASVPQMVTAASGEVTFGFGYIRYYDPFTPIADLSLFNTITTSNSIQLQDADGDWGQALDISSVNKGIVLRAPTNPVVPVGAQPEGDSQYIYYVNITITTPLGPNFGDGTNKIPLAARLLERKRGVPIEFDSETVVLPSPNPAIFETEPKEGVDLDLYYEATDALPIAGLNNAQLLNYFNCYSFGNGVESDRIEDDFNAKVIGKGTKVSTTLENTYEEERRGAGLIYSGIFNSTSGVNELNQFIAGLKITKDLNPIYGTIQKLYARDTDLTVLMEDKIFKVLANKDALFNADGNTNLTSTDNVLGQTMPYGGAFGISKNPESFATFGFRAYFVDKARGAVMRLSRDGLTKISSNGMSDYFIDNLKLNTTGNIIGSYDSDSGSYNVCINVPDVRTNPGENPPAFSNSTESVAFKEKVNGWTTTMSYIPEAGISLNNEYYTFKSGEIWEHSSETRSNFYGTQFSSTVTPIINDAPTSVKKFKTLAYEGTAGWRSEIVTDQQNGEVPVFVKKEGSFYNYIQGIDTTVANLDTQEFSTQGLGSLLLNAPVGTSTLVINGAINVSLQANPQDPGGGAAGVAALDTIYTMSPGNTLRIVGTVIGINRTTNTITLAANIAGSALQAGDFVFFGKDTRINTSGIIGYYAETKMITTDPTKEELFSISSEVFISSE